MIKIFQVNDINPDLLPLQVASFRKYMREDFEFIVLGSEVLSNNPEKAAEVSKVCRSLSIQTLEVPRDPAIEAAWQRGANPGEFLFHPKTGRFVTGKGGAAFNYMLQWAWERVLTKEPGPVCFIHTDVFLMESIKLTDYLREYSLCCVLHREKNTNHPEDKLCFMWEALLLAKCPELPNPETTVWFPSRVEGTWLDTGGPTHYYLKAHPEIRLLEIPTSGCFDDPEVDFHPARYQFFHLGDKRIFHYQSGSKWCTDMKGYWGFSKEKSDEYHAKKLAWTRNLIGL
jgi:hypothetical protein